VLLDMEPDRHLAGVIRKRLEIDGDRVSDLHLWRLGPGHPGLIASVVSTARSRLRPIGAGSTASRSYRT